MGAAGLGGDGETKEPAECSVGADRAAGGHVVGR